MIERFITALTALAVTGVTGMTAVIAQQHFQAQTKATPKKK